MTVTIMRGPSGSGKSTLTKIIHDTRGGVIISRDIIRQMFGARDKTVLAPEQEKIVTRIEFDLLREALNRGENVIIDDTNLDNKRAAKIVDRVHALGHEYEEINLYREGMDWVYVERSTIPEKVVLRQCKSARKMKPLEDFIQVPRITPVVQNSERRSVYIFDIDGTTANIDSDNPRSPYDESRISEDVIVAPVADLYTAVDELFGGQLLPVFVSGRSEECRAETIEWLVAHLDLDYVPKLYMRAAGDTRPDAIVKREILETLVRNYYVQGVVDDRERVLDMWRASGIYTFDVGQGKAKF